MIDLLKKEAKKYDKYVLMCVSENRKFALGWLGNPYEEDQDLPILVVDKKSGKIDEKRIPPNIGLTKDTWLFEEDEQYQEENQEKLKKMIDGEKEDTKMEDSDVEENKIKKLLKMYGAKDNEIKNFIDDLKNMKDEETQNENEDGENDFNYLDSETMGKLSATKEGKQLIADAPSMAKDKLAEAIKKFLGN